MKPAISLSVRLSIGSDFVAAHSPCRVSGSMRDGRLDVSRPRDVLYPPWAGDGGAGHGFRELCREWNARVGHQKRQPQDRHLAAAPARAATDCRAAEQRDELAPLNFEHGATRPCSV